MAIAHITPQGYVNKRTVKTTMKTKQQPPSSLILTPDISPIDRSRWIPFIQNDELSSYSFYLPHDDTADTSSKLLATDNSNHDNESTTRTNNNNNTNNNPNPNPNTTSNSIFTSKQLDEWFNKLHPSRYNNDNDDDDDDDDDDDYDDDDSNKDGTNDSKDVVVSPSIITSTSSSLDSDTDSDAWTSASYNNQLLLRKTAWYTFNEECVCEYGYSDTWQPQIKNKHMIETLKEITEKVSKIVGNENENKNEELLNCVNLNYYPNGGGIGFHSDDEFLFDGLNHNTKIISLSLCCSTSCRSSNSCSSLSLSLKSKPINTNTNTNKNYDRNWGARKFQIKRNNNNGGDDNDDKIVHEIILRHGDIITMEGMFQKYYLHSVWPGDDDNEKQQHTASDLDLCQGERINLTWRTIVKHLDGGSEEECRGITCPLSL